jgi:hypothetical protein
MDNGISGKNGIDMKAQTDIVNNLKSLGAARNKAASQVLARIQKLVASKLEIEKELKILVDAAEGVGIEVQDEVAAMNQPADLAAQERVYSQGLVSAPRPAVAPHPARGGPMVPKAVAVPSKLSDGPLSGSWVETLRKIDEVLARAEGGRAFGRDILNALKMKNNLQPSAILNPLVTRGYLDTKGVGRWVTYGRTSRVLPSTAG